MKHRLVLTGFLITLVFIAAMLAQADIERSARPAAHALKGSLGDNGFAACGLHKLTDQELEQLTMLLVARPAASYLETSATRFLEENDWRPVTVLGVHEMHEGISPELVLLVMDAYELVLLKKFFHSDELPPPGVYWAQSSLSSWKLLLPDGKPVDFRSIATR